jgi:hypothetical protein
MIVAIIVASLIVASHGKLYMKGPSLMIGHE